MLNCWNPISGNFQSTFPGNFGPTFVFIFYLLLSTLLHILTFGRKVHRYLIGRGSGQEVFVPGQGVCSNIKTLSIFHFSIRSSILIVPGLGVCSNIKTRSIFHFSIRSSILKYSLFFFVFFFKVTPKGFADCAYLSIIKKQNIYISH